MLACFALSGFAVVLGPAPVFLRLLARSAAFQVTRGEREAIVPLGLSTSLAPGAVAGSETSIPLWTQPLVAPESLRLRTHQ